MRPRSPKRTAASPATITRLRQLLGGGPMDIDDVCEQFVRPGAADVTYLPAETLESILWSYPDQFRLDGEDRWFRVDLGPEVRSVTQYCCPTGKSLGKPICLDCSPTLYWR